MIHIDVFQASQFVATFFYFSSPFLLSLSIFLYSIYI